MKQENEKFYKRLYFDEGIPMGCPLFFYYNVLVVIHVLRLRYITIKSINLTIKVQIIQLFFFDYDKMMYICTRFLRNEEGYKQIKGCAC